MRVKDLIKHLKTYDPDTPIAYDLWLPEDIQDCASNIGITLSLTDASFILDGINSRKDCSIGINWDVIETHISMFTGK